MARDSVLAYLGASATLVLAFAAKVMLARTLAPADYGLLVVAQTLVGLGTSLVLSGLLDTVVRFVGAAATRDMAVARGVVIRALQLNVLAVIPLSAGLCISAGWLAEHLYRQLTLWPLLVLLALAMPFTTVAELLAAAYRGLRRVWVKVLFIDVGRNVCVILGIALLALLNSSSVTNMAVVYALGALTTATVVTALFLRDRAWRTSASSANASDLFRYALPLVGSSLALLPVTAIPLLLGGAVSMQAVAYYNLAFVLANLLYMPTAAVDTAALPAWSERIAARDLSSLRVGYVIATRWCIIAGVAVFGPLVLRAPDILGLIYGPPYAAAASVVRVVALLFLLNACTGPSQSLLRAFGYTHRILLAHLVGGVGALAIATALIPTWGMAGALAALATSTVLALTLESYSLFRLERLHPLNSHYFMTLMAGALALVAMHWAQPLLGSDGLRRVIATSILYNAIFFSILRLFRIPFAIDHRHKDLIRRTFGLPPKPVTPHHE